ncbi:4'-phosphopantetheinyl transferase [Bombiscardovia apis]|uniref:Holo-[acyl-carrier-protein] synthase n=1 Tax=Bombiscardovia apis TaxID=2932182 RepID=A0ABM8BEE7_9BIFI|nr:holo-ACP synthase [Bombiscardovia apis]BDR55264.1 4'-phosphopantetheinyl transferase [Bombiscardovia apis]
MEHGESFEGMGRVLGVGNDLVELAGFGEQLGQTGTRIRSLFSARELRQADQLGQSKADGELPHLAARWAGKESVLKAWSSALGSRPDPYSQERFPYAGIEILDDSRGRPSVYLTQEVEKELITSLELEQAPVWMLSLTHDGPLAAAVVILGLPD